MEKERGSYICIGNCERYGCMRVKSAVEMTERRGQRHLLYKPRIGGLYTSLSEGAKYSYKRRNISFHYRKETEMKKKRT
jgi:hypothetical protein